MFNLLFGKLFLDLFKGLFPFVLFILDDLVVGISPETEVVGVI
jgi:hypothetical protein